MRYTEYMKTGIASWKALIRFVLYYFSIGGLLRTLFVPWRQERYVSDQPGIWKYIEQGTFYIFAVVVGLVARIGTIIFGLLVLITVIAMFPIFSILPISISFEDLSKSGSLGKQWAYPTTWELNKHGRDIRKDKEVLVIDHDEAIAQTERVLAREHQQNVLIVGQQGIGKTTRLAYLARKMYRDLSVKALNSKRLVQLFPEEMAIEDIRICVQEAVKAKNVVLVIENIERFNIIGILEPYLESDHFQMILTTDWASYNATYKHHDNLMRVSEVVEMYPPNDETTLLYLMDWVVAHKAQSRFSKEVLEKVIALTNMLMINAAQPEKSIDVLEELNTLDAPVVTQEHVEALISQKTRVPLGALRNDEKQKLLHLEEVLTQHVIGQDKAVHAIASALKRGRAGVQDSPKPIGSFLFLGPTGVGKTHTAKMLAAYYFGGEHLMIRFDMSEFRDLASMDRFTERLASSVEEMPFGLVFFDEIEKAHPDILNIFLQILDEGEFHTSNGRTISFRNSIIICTSNAGANYLMENDTQSQELVIDHIVHTGILKPEFINRFDATILYRTLDRSGIEKVTILMLDSLNKQLRKKHNLEIIITAELVRALARRGHDTKFGVRPLKRLIQNSIETFIADKLLEEHPPQYLSLFFDVQHVDEAL